MLVPSTITVRRPSGESDFILTRVDPSTTPGHPGPDKVTASPREKASLGSVPFQRPKANSASCIIDGIKASHFLSAMGAYMIRPEEYFLSPSSVQLFGCQGQSPARKSSWQSVLKKDLGKLKMQTVSYVKGSMDSLLSRLSGGDAARRRISEFLYASNGLVLEILPQDSGPHGRSQRTRRGRSSQSPVRKSSSQLSRGRNHSIPADGPGDVSYETLQQHLSRLDNIISSRGKSSAENPIPDFRKPPKPLQPSAPDHLDYPSDRRVSDSNIQLPEDFSKNCPDRSFNCPLQGVSIYDGRFRACLPLSSFPLGHVCLKVRGYRLEIAHLIGNGESSDDRRAYLTTAVESLRHEHQRLPGISCDGHRMDSSARNSHCSSRNESLHERLYNARHHQPMRTCQFEVPQLSRAAETKSRRNPVSSDSGRVRYRYLGSVSIPIFVEPSTLDFSLDGDMRWLKIHGAMKGCISSSCLSLEDHNSKE